MMMSDVMMMRMMMMMIVMVTVMMIAPACGVLFVGRRAHVRWLLSVGRH